MSREAKSGLMFHCLNFNQKLKTGTSLYGTTFSECVTDIVHDWILRCFHLLACNQKMVIGTIESYIKDVGISKPNLKFKPVDLLIFLNQQSSRLECPNKSNL